jgi:hypothetical protein
MRWWRPKRGWWHELAGWVLGCVSVFPGAMLAVLASQYLGAWAIVALGASLAILLIASAGFFFVKRHTWLLAAPLGFGLGFSFALPLIEGWGAQMMNVVTILRAGIGVASVALVIAAIVFGVRTSRRVDRAMRAIALDAGEQIAHEGLFRDDGERITVYVNRGKTLWRVFTGALALALFAGGYLWARATVLDTFWQFASGLCIAFLLVYGGVNLLLTFMRAAMSGPTLIINADRIVDNCSMVATGRGLLRWNETLAVEAFSFSTNRFITYHFLDINVTDAAATRRRQPLWKRALGVILIGSR